MVKTKNSEFVENAGHFKITLENNDKLLLTRIEYGNLKQVENHEGLLFESTSGNFYKPVVNDGNIDFKYA